MHIKFLQDFDFTPKEDQRITTAYKVGWVGLVRKDCSTAAIAQGKAVEVPRDKDTKELEDGKTTERGADEPKGNSSKAR